jgi:hypothetical protein
MTSTSTISPLLSPSVRDDARAYADALDEIGGKDLADLILVDEEDPKAKKALSKLKGAKRDETLWITGWFRGVADVLGCEAISVLDAARKLKAA